MPTYMNNEERVSPMGMWRWGKDFIESALKIHPPPKNDIEELRQRVSITAYYLLAHGIELQMKAFLLSKGYQLKDLRSYKKFGHNLDALMDEAIGSMIGDCVALSEYERGIISLLNRTYKEKDLTTTV